MKWIELMVSEAVKTSQIECEYYDALGRASSGDLDITECLIWFTGMVLDAQKQAKEQISFVLAKARFWDSHATLLNDRQTRVLSRMLREGRDGFKGGMSAQK